MCYYSINVLIKGYLLEDFLLIAKALGKLIKTKLLSNHELDSEHKSTLRIINNIILYLVSSVNEITVGEN